MSWTKLFVCGLFIATLAACQPSSGSTKSTAAAATVDPSKQFGAPITADGAITYNELLARLQTVDSMEVKVRGRVDGVCQAKGCWMNIASGKDDVEDMFVKFKDYGFFVPKDISGREVIMYGMAYREVTPVDELRHYAEDEGKSEEEIAAITQPKEELKFMASGVLLLD